MPARIPTAEWILTFDDGPLPADVTTFDAADPRAKTKLLKPLKTILKKLREHLGGPIRAMFFLRGPAFPWPSPVPPPNGWVFRSTAISAGATASNCRSRR